jgi:hypothetical protein
MQVRYQAAPRPDRKRMIAQLGGKDFESRPLFSGAKS